MGTCCTHARVRSAMVGRRRRHARASRSCRSLPFDNSNRRAPSSQSPSLRPRGVCWLRGRPPPIPAGLCGGAPAAAPLSGVARKGRRGGQALAERRDRGRRHPRDHWTLATAVGQPALMGAVCAGLSPEKPWLVSKHGFEGLDGRFLCRHQPGAAATLGVTARRTLSALHHL
jgi:hypothetical protein